MSCGICDDSLLAAGGINETYQAGQACDPRWHGKLTRQDYHVPYPGGDPQVSPCCLLGFTTSPTTTFPCTQQAKGTQLREELSGPRPSIRGETKISPLVGAAFSSNWVLFRQVYDSYEELTGAYWWRSMVRKFLGALTAAQRINLGCA